MKAFLKGQAECARFADDATGLGGGMEGGELRERGCHFALVQTEDAEVLLSAVVPDGFFKRADVFRKGLRTRPKCSFAVWEVRVDDSELRIAAEHDGTIT